LRTTPDARPAAAARPGLSAKLPLLRAMFLRLFGCWPRVSLLFFFFAMFDVLFNVFD
jgi:hypothetical protein